MLQDDIIAPGEYTVERTVDNGDMARLMLSPGNLVSAADESEYVISAMPGPLDDDNRVTGHVRHNDIAIVLAVVHARFKGEIRDHVEYLVMCGNKVGWNHEHCFRLLCDGFR